MEAMKSDTPEVAMQGIEFWSNICDEELELALEEHEDVQILSRNYAKGALQYLIPILMQKLTQQVSNFDSTPLCVL